MKEEKRKVLPARSKYGFTITREEHKPGEFPKSMRGSANRASDNRKPSMPAFRLPPIQED